MKIRTSTNASGALLLCLLISGLQPGCGGGIASRQPDKPDVLLSIWHGPPAQVYVTINRGNPDPDQVQRCKEAVSELGLRSRPEGAEATVEIDISRETKTLKVTSAKRGYLRQETRPAWSVEDLCRDGLAAALRIVQEDRSGVIGAVAAPASSEGVPDDPWSVLSAWSGPPPQVAVVLGTRASNRQRQICNEALRKFGMEVRSEAPVVATVEVAHSERSGEDNQLRVVSARRGLVVEGFRPGWLVEELCKDALAQALKAYRLEFGSREQARAPGRL